jgi:hypothetical protein
MKFKEGDILEFSKGRAAYAANDGAQAIFTGKFYIDRDGGELIEVKWVRNGDDNGQKDGEYYTSMFTKVGEVSTQKENRIFEENKEMEERIQVNGVWYVREINPTPEIEIKNKDISFSMERVWESSDWCFIAHVIMLDGAETLDDHYPDPYIKITDKRPLDRENWIEDDVDNPIFMFGVLEGNPDSMKDAREMFDEQGLEEFKAFLRYLIKVGWLKK